MSYSYLSADCDNVVDVLFKPLVDLSVDWRSIAYLCIRINIKLLIVLDLIQYYTV